MDPGVVADYAHLEEGRHIKGADAQTEAQGQGLEIIWVGRAVMTWTKKKTE